jgi:DNA-binding response OmpR family regulator
MKKKKKVLVVENETPTAMMIVSWLTQIGFDVRVAAKGQKGLKIAQERKFDLIILEAELQEISGFEIFEDLRQRHISYRTPVIFLSDQNEYCERALSLGADDAVQKPFGAEDFITRVLSAVEETKMA